MNWHAGWADILPDITHTTLKNMMDAHISKGFGPAMRRVYKDNFDDTHHTLIVSLNSQSQNENCPLAALTFQKESGC